MTSQIIPVPPFSLIVFGGTGDLARRKIMPSLYHRFRDGQAPPESRVIAVSRSETDTVAYRAAIGDALAAHLPPSDTDPNEVVRFLDRLTHVRLDASDATAWPALAGALGGEAPPLKAYYLATAPELFGPICDGLAASGLIDPDSRVVLEKPLGRDRDSARRINAAVGAVFDERQIFRIDHYLGKETVQNLMALRFGNSLFEPLWNGSAIDHVQITVAESLGVEGRGAYYDRAGALRDMVQNHLLQLLCLVAMEPPTRFDADSVRDEKLKVLRALRPIGTAEAGAVTVRGQYRAGAVGGAAVVGYGEEAGDAAVAETFVALRADILNWRWSGTPFYLRTGKRMPERMSEIIVEFRRIPHSIFAPEAGPIAANRLVIRLQPDEGVKLMLMIKDPGPGGMRLREVPLNLSFAETFGVRSPDAYERLLMDVIRGNQTLFMRLDEVEAAWSWIDPIHAGWTETGQPARPYTAGTWGPSASVALIERDGRTWHEDGA